MRKLKLVVIVTMSTFIMVMMGSLFYADPLPAIIHEMQIDLYPQEDGSVEMHYSFDYELNTPQSMNGESIAIKMPNSNFEIQDIHPSERFSHMSSLDSSTALLRFTEGTVPQAHERFLFDFTLVQNKLFYEGESDDSITLMFTPGSFDSALVNKVIINVDRSLLSPTDFKLSPAVITDEKYTWKFYELRQGELTDPIHLTYLKKDFKLIEGALVEKANPLQLLKVLGITVAALGAYLIFIRITGNKHTGGPRYLLRMPGQRY